MADVNLVYWQGLYRVSNDDMWPLPHNKMASKQYTVTTSASLSDAIPREAQLVEVYPAELTYVEWDYTDSPTATVNSKACPAGQITYIVLGPHAADIRLSMLSSV